MPDIAALSVFVGANTEQAEAGLGRVAEMLGPAGPLLIGVGAAGLAVAGIGIASVKMAGDFQEGLTTLVTGAGESKANIDLVSKGMLDLAVQTGTSTQQLTAGMFMVESAGYHGQAGLNVLRDAAEGAKVGNADLGVVADATTTIMKDYASQNITSAQAVNALIATVSSGKTHMADLAGAMAQILPTSSAAGVGLNDVMAAMATMTGEGVPAANAATYLRQTILALDAPGKLAVDTLKSVGLSASQVAAEMQQSLPATMQMIVDAVGKHFPAGSAAYVSAIKDIAGGSKQMQGILDLTGSHMTDFQHNMQGISDQVKAGGTSIVGWTEVQGDFNQKMSQLKEIAETVMIRLGQGLLPAATALAGALGGALLFATTHIGQVMQVLGPILLGVAVAIGASLVPALIAALPVLLAAAGAAIAAAAPFLLIAAAVAGLAFAFQYAYTHFAPFREAVNTAVAAVKQFGGELETRLQPIIKNVFAFIQTAIAFLEPIWKAVWPSMLAVLTGVWHMIQGEIEIAWAIVSGIIKIGLDLLSGNWAGAWKDLQDMLKGVWAGIQTFLGGALQAIGGVITGFFNGLVATVQQIGSHIIQGLIDGIKNMAGGAVAAVQSIGSSMLGGLKSLLGIHSPSTVFAEMGTNMGLGMIAGFAGANVAQAIQGHLSGALTLPAGTNVLPAVGPSGVAHAQQASAATTANASGGAPAQPIYLQLDGQTFARLFLPYVASAIRATVGVRAF